MDYLPIFCDSKRLSCLVIGGGAVAQRKVESLLAAHAVITVVALTVNDSVKELAQAGRLQLHQRAYEDDDLRLANLAVVATNDEQLNERIAAAAHAAGVLVNVVDNPRLCSFIMPSIVDRSPVVIAVSTGGAAPMLARLLRARLETMIPAAYGQLATVMRDFRDRVRTRLPEATARRRFWETALTGAVAERIFEGKHGAALETLELLLKGQTQAATNGEVYLVGGGPGDPDLLTFRALRLMQQADVVVYDRLVAPAIVALCRKDAERIFVGKKRDEQALSQSAINALLVAESTAGRRVLRLKGGDPFVFGRGGEEIDTLAEHGIPFQIVPGISAANGCAAYAGIPLTHRDYAQQCLFVTGHQKSGDTELRWDTLVQDQQTLAIYMGMHSLEYICEKLLANGMRAQMPAALIERGTTPQQRVLVKSIEELAAAARHAKFAAPAMLIVGEVVALHEKLNWFETPAG